MTYRYVRDVPSKAMVYGETLIYTAGCLDFDKTGITFTNCTFICEDDAARADWERLIAPYIVSSVDAPPE